jgi:hypothetical protein
MTGRFNSSAAFVENGATQARDSRSFADLKEKLRQEITITAIISAT